MRKSCLIALLFAILVTSATLGQAEAGISTSSQYVKPGDSVGLVFTGSPGSNFTVTITSSRATLENVSLVFDEFGEYQWSYTVNETSATDGFRVRATINGVVEETGFIVSRMEPSQLANIMRTMAENSKRQAQTALIEAKQKGTLNTDMVVAHRDAVQALEDSRQYATQGDHTEAFESIRNAMNLFETIINDYYMERSPPEKSESDRELVRAQEAIQALKKSLSELNETSDNLERKGFNVEILEKGIENMMSGISLAEDNLESGDLDGALIKIREATQTRTRIQDALRKRLQELNKPKVQSYQSSLLNRYTSMKNTLTAIQSVDSDRISGVITNLNAIETKLDQARSLYAQGKYVESVRTLQSADQEFKETFSQINGDRTQTLLNSLDKLSLELEKETSQVNRDRIQARIDTVENTLRTRLQAETNTTPKPSARKSTSTATPSVTP